MNREEAIKLLKDTIERLSAPNGYLWPDERKVLLDAFTALRGPVPDPKTGLVPCGCGGKAFVYCPVDMTDVFVIRCEKCRVGITFAMDLPRAKKEWNTAMGWKGGAE